MSTKQFVNLKLTLVFTTVNYSFPFMIMKTIMLCFNEVYDKDKMIAAVYKIILYLLYKLGIKD